MTQSSDRLDRIEAILANVAERQQAAERWHEFFQIDLEAMRQRQEQADVNLRESISDTVTMIVDLAEQQQETDQRIDVLRQQQTETDQRFNTFLEDARADRQRADEREERTRQRLDALRQQQVEADQRFNILLEEAREDRRRNEQEHSAFVENMRTMFLEITRIWQRLTG